MHTGAAPVGSGNFMLPEPLPPSPPGARSRIDFSVFDPPFLARRVREWNGLTEPDEIAAWLAALATGREEADRFFESLKIGFTDFFRDPLSWAVLERVVLPRLAESGRPEIRAWSAGCATGQEAWSLALLLEDEARAGARPLSCRVIGTDISDASLAVASEGAYPEDSLGNLRLRHVRDYLTLDRGIGRFTEALRSRVSFSRLDLIDPRSQSPAESIYGGFDLVLCCNLLLYYRPDVRNLILGKLRRALVPGGCLVTGEAERGIVEKAGGFRAVAPPAAVFEREP